MPFNNHLEILRRGVGEWNAWRYGRHHITPDLSGANLRGMDLSTVDFMGANLSKAILREANLTDAKLIHADLRGADCGGANLMSADLRGAILDGVDLGQADLSYVNFIGASLYRTYLGNANLYGASLDEAKFIDVKFRGANFERARVGNSIFSEIDLRGAVGLEQVKHVGGSDISGSSLYRSEGQIPEVFLRGCGFRDWEIEAARLYRTDLSREQIIELTYKLIELRSDPLIQFYSCFISYSSKDEEFANRLYTDLQRSGVRCWFAPEDMKIGDKIRHRIDVSIRLHDKLLLILSETSISRQWIEQEVETAFEKERERGCEVLFPIRLDNEVTNIRQGWPAFIRNTRHIGDFSQWEDSGKYERAFARLLNDLRESP